MEKYYEKVYGNLISQMLIQKFNEVFLTISNGRVEQLH